MTVQTRPPTITEAAGWLKANEHCPEYCRACLKHWKAIVGDVVAMQMFERAPESVRKWIKEREAK